MRIFWIVSTALILLNLFLEHQFGYWEASGTIPGWHTTYFRSSYLQSVLPMFSFPALLVSIMRAVPRFNIPTLWVDISGQLVLASGVLCIARVAAHEFEMWQQGYLLEELAFNHRMYGAIGWILYWVVLLAPLVLWFKAIRMNPWLTSWIYGYNIFAYSGTLQYLVGMLLGLIYRR